MKTIGLVIFSAFCFPVFTCSAQQTTPDLPDAPSVVTAKDLPSGAIHQEQESVGQSSKNGENGPARQGQISSPRTGDPQMLSRGYGPMAPWASNQPMTESQKWAAYTHQTFGPPALVFPAIGAVFRLARPPSGYPPEWTDGAGAFGRQYGNTLAAQTSKRTASFLTETALHEDPGYMPAGRGTGTFERIAHAVAFTFVDRTDSGGRTFAFNNFAGAAAGGFVGMAYLPDGFNDPTHAGQRAASELGGEVIANIAQEFAPEWAPIARKLHIPKIVPAWWVPEHKAQP